MNGRLLVPFEGDGAGAGELSWGQRTMWIPMRLYHTSISLGMTFPLAAGVTVDDIAAQLRFLMGRHPALRTRFEFDAAADRQARQVVWASGELAVDFVDSESAGPDPDQAAKAVNDRLHETEFDYRDEWPVRCVVVTHQGAPTHLVMAFCHLVMDGFGIRAMLLDLARRAEDRIGMTAALAEPDGTLPPARAEAEMHPLDQARWQASPAGQRINENTVRYWKRLLGEVPARRFPGCADPGEPRQGLVLFQSRAARLAAQAVADRLGMRTAPVLFAAYAVAVARVTGSNPVLAQIILSNRFRPGLVDSVGSVSQPALVAIDAADATFDEVVRRAWRAQMTAARHSYYDPYGQEALLAAMSEERGEPIEIQCLFNDRRLPAHSGPQEPTTPDELAAALPSTTLEWYEPRTLSREPFMTSVEPQDPGMIVWSVFFSTGFLSADRVEAFLREMEAVLVDAAFDPGCPALPAEAARGPLRAG